VCQELFSIFFEDFQSVRNRSATFPTAASEEAACLVYQTETRLSRTFFAPGKLSFPACATPKRQL
ncbi:MAG TPA: hypothetical protein H9835_09045, partial [Candidatus Agathobaculum merdigallinarum]|nr:hypothetical protein [Candidatus Agathobaculum merdigallinarum]